MHLHNFTVALLSALEIVTHNVLALCRSQKQFVMWPLQIVYLLSVVRLYLFAKRLQIVEHKGIWTFTINHLFLVCL